MTSIDRFQDDLPVTLIDIADERMPDYVDDLLGRTAAMRQRPAWTFPGRWLPMADLIVQRRFVPRVPWRALAIAALLALLVAGALLYAGSRRHVPAPFGPAANGSIAYASGGDLFTADPRTGQSRLLLGGSEADSSPLFSPDGLRVAYLRASPSSGFDLMVVSAEGGSPLKLSAATLTDGATFQWAPDSASLIVPYPTGELVRFNATNGSSTTIATNVDVDIHAFRPPDGRQIMVQKHGDNGSLLLIDADGTHPTSIVPAGDLGTFEQARWSPDGSQITFGRSPDGSDQNRQFIMQADGTGLRQLTTDPGRWYETDPTWSPNGTRVAFNRWMNSTSTGDWLIKPIAIVTVASGEVVESRFTPVSEGEVFEWSPDGASLLGLPAPHATYGSANTDAPVVIDALTGEATPLTFRVESAVSWQRTAP
ncbi:MAG: TolB protein [Chloroflexota bacterium]|jgi:Tol biopolymer transport system component|nr:TolB protein [Chloroflexota bacterium]